MRCLPPNGEERRRLRVSVGLWTWAMFGNGSICWRCKSAKGKLDWKLGLDYRTWALFIRFLFDVVFLI